MNYENDEIRHRPQNINLWESERMQAFRKAGLIGCFNGTGVTSDNYKDHLNGYARKPRVVRKKQKVT